MSYSQKARAAIEKMVAAKHRQDKGKWGKLIPAKNRPLGWGSDEARWTTEAETAIVHFKETIDVTIEVPDAAITFHHAKPLVEFRSYLRDKAQEAFAHKQIEAAKARLARISFSLRGVE